MSAADVMRQFYPYMSDEEIAWHLGAARRRMDDEIRGWERRRRLSAIRSAYRRRRR